MQRSNIVDIAEVRDESQNLRRVLRPLDGSSWAPTGRYIVLRENGTPHLEISYQDGILHGAYVSYWRNGKVDCEGQHSDGKREGTWHFYNEDGAIHAIIQFRAGKVIDFSQYGYDPDGTLRDIGHLDEFQNLIRKEGEQERDIQDHF